MGRALSAFFVLLMLLGCQRGDSDYFGTIRPKHGPNELWLNNGSEPEYLDSGLLADSAGSALVWNLMAGLVQTHPATLQPMPDLASRWDVSEDGLTYTFILRDGIVWSDGRPLTAEDFAWSWRRVLDPKTGSKYASFLYVLKNAEAINQRALWVPGATDAAAVESRGGADVGSVTLTDYPEPGAFVYVAAGLDAKARTQARDRLKQRLGCDLAPTSLAGIEVIDDRTLVARLQDPIPYFLSQAAFYTFLPVPRHVMDDLESRGIDAARWTDPEHMVTSGAYTLTSHRFRQYYKFDKNPLYWDADNTRIEHVKALLIDSYATGLNMYRAGETDWTGTNSSLPSHFMDHLEEFQDFRRDKKLSVYMFWMNVDKIPDVRVRKALSLAIDRQAIVDNVTKADQIPTAALVPDELNGYDGLDLEIFNPEKARELLDEVRAENGGELHELSLMYNTSEGHKKIAEAVQQMWKDHLGIEVELSNQEWKVFLKTRNAMEFQMARGGWVGDYADPYTFLELLSSNNGNNTSAWTNPQYDELLARANASPDHATRMALLREAEDLMLADQPVIPMYVYTKSQMIKPYVKGFWGNYQDRHPWKFMYIDEDWQDGKPDPPPTPIPFQ